MLKMLPSVKIGALLASGKSLVFRPMRLPMRDEKPEKIKLPPETMCRYVYPDGRRCEGEPSEKRQGYCKKHWEIWMEAQRAFRNRYNLPWARATIDDFEAADLREPLEKRPWPTDADQAWANRLPLAQRRHYESMGTSPAPAYGKETYRR